MQRFLSLSLAVFIFFCVMIASARQAFGYVDPGQGLIALQGLASAAAAFGYFMRRRIASLFRKSPTQDVSKESNSANAA